LNCLYGSLLCPDPESPLMTTLALSRRVVPVSVYAEIPGID
jgi:hypothetical protein